jgi:hypothetical protein
MSAPETPRGRLRNFLEVHIGCERYLACVDLKDRLATALVRQINDYAAIEPTRPQQRPVENVGLVGRCKHDHPFAT